MNDAISRSAVLEMISRTKTAAMSDEAKFTKSQRNAIRAIADLFSAVVKDIPTIDAVPVVHEKDIRSSIITVENVDEWQGRIILADDGTRVCAVYYADGDDCVPVVRCKDCRYSEPMPDRGVSKFGADALNCTQCRGDDGYGYAGISMIRPDDFCSDGALKDGDPHD